jgi:hypothetical protein
MPAPPSIMSYYADVPLANKGTRPICNPHPSSNFTIFNNESQAECVCATSHRSWYPCTEHPWAQNLSAKLSDSFSMIDCGGTDRSFEIQVNWNPSVLDRSELLKGSLLTDSTSSRPNILIIELDSVSTAYSDRHFPRTRELLNSLRIRKNSANPRGFSCGKNETLCAVEFETVSVVGPSSIPNQLAIFGSCVVSVETEICSTLETDVGNRTICTDQNSPEFGMELVSRLRASATFCKVDELGRSPWIFDIGKKAGYVTLFSEDFCYEGSIYVPQGNLFTLDVDLLPANLFCRVSELNALRMGFKMNEPAWRYSYKPWPGAPGCVDANGGYEVGMVALHHVESMWDAYHDIPKFAYINSIAAHQYDDYRK